LADDALEQGDAPRALKLLARIWEGGSLNPYVEARLALAALAVGLTEVVEALTEAPSRSTEHAIVRLIHAAQRGEQFSVAGVASATETVFAIRSHLRILAVCGRHDLVEAVAQAHLDLPGIQTALHGLPREAAPSHELIKVDIDAARETFTKHWRGPGGLAASNWAWAVAREIGVGEHRAVAVALAGRPARLARSRARHGGLDDRRTGCGRDRRARALAVRAGTLPARRRRGLARRVR
jgi:hypothetical protein